MGLLDSFEKGLERAVNSAFAKTFRSGIQPVEIASALRAEIDAKAAVVSRDRILAPNAFTVSLSNDDAERMRSLGSALDDELSRLVAAHASTQGFSFAGPVTISLVADPQRATGTVGVASATAVGDVSWHGVLEIAGIRHPLAKARTVIGRGSDADITLDDSGASRRHVEVLWDGERAMVRDLGSTNGTLLDGRRIGNAPLPPDAVFTVGRTEIRFRVVAQAAPSRPAPPDDATRSYPLGGAS
ncbi:FhaA domain-containing protein [Microbacterium sp. No. 7]|uniref:FhaA domain-containing protein n=1 Tax=Microbacterium sp. No. 7 TaxID=1714373 RepID=UPI0006D07CD2|nr:DUF3662 and FHA domain-containing protein [Microbacterium sp. No. 7]ALJ18481.1 phosphopeptide-binding protein [Microbacterium sp. No. 7]